MYDNPLVDFEKIHPEFIIARRDGSTQYGYAIRWQFENGWGASVSSNPWANGGEPEFAVLKGGSLNYSSGITEDVIPAITVHEFALHCAKLRGM